MKQLNFVLLFFFLAPLQIFSQQQQISGNLTLEQLMQEKIMTLKNGALLVRLQTMENSVNALRKNKNPDLANQVEAKQLAYNKELIEAFRKEFNFCPVYFFQSHYSDSLLSDRIEGVVFVNDSVKPDPAIRCSQRDYLTAEVGPLDPDTASYFEGHYYGRDGDGVEKKEAYYSGADTGLEALKIMNNHFVQLKRPFPYYARTYESLPVEKKLTKVVAKMNKQLSDYYAKSVSK